jgi:5'-phosphate synthase pdxT subunit
MPPIIGIVAIQGDFEKHAESLHRLDSNLDVRFVRTPEELTPCERLIIPGGESTTVGKLMDRFGLGKAIQERAEQGMPIWGTCMGMIMMAREVEGREQYSLNLLDIKVRRNAFGAQVHSFEDEVPIKDLNEPVMGVFIRAPVVTDLGADVESIAEYEGKIVGVREGRRMGTSFHPELTPDTRLHAYFLKL